MQRVRPRKRSSAPRSWRMAAAVLGCTLVGCGADHGTSSRYSVSAQLAVPHASGAVNLGGNLAEFEAAPSVQVTSGAASATFRLLWDESFLYVSAKVTDTNLRYDGSGEDGSLWNGDAIEVLLDPRHTRSLTPDADDRQIVINARNDTCGS
jgi:hypothetical protein